MGARGLSLGGAVEVCAAAEHFGVAAVGIYGLRAGVPTRVPIAHSPLHGLPFSPLALRNGLLSHR